MIRVWFFNTGYCTVSEHYIVPTSPRRLTRAYALAMLLEHPREGFILFDTGYAPRILESFGQFPYGIYGRLTPTTVHPDWTIQTQLKALGISPQAIRYVILSHLHADHIAGLKDFQQATVILAGTAQRVLSLKRVTALRHGFLPALLPEMQVQFIQTFSDGPLSHFPTHDLFKDGSLQLLPLPGHARGQMGALLQTQQGRLLLAADGAWSSRSFRENIPPHRLAMHLVFDDVAATLSTLKGLHLLHQQAPDMKIIPTHCPEIAQKVSLGVPTPLGGLW